MDNLQTLINNYLEYCQYQKRLDSKTLKAYRIDLRQFSSCVSIDDAGDITTITLESYIAKLNHEYKPKTVRRKLASVKALFHYFEYKDIVEPNPFNKMHLKLREPLILPKTIPLHIVETLLSTIYKQCKNAPTDYQRKNALRDAAVVELLFATGIRISELCSLKVSDVNLYDRTILIYGKGAKERDILIAKHPRKDFRI